MMSRDIGNPRTNHTTALAACGGVHSRWEHVAILFYVAEPGRHELPPPAVPP